MAYFDLQGNEINEASEDFKVFQSDPRDDGNRTARNFIDKEGNIVSSNDGKGEVLLSAEAVNDPFMVGVTAMAMLPDPQNPFDPAAVQAIYDLKKTDPNQFYDKAAEGIANTIFFNFRRNESSRNEPLYNQLEAIKTESPEAYYKAKIGVVSQQIGWNHGQNTMDRTGPLQEELASLMPEAASAGLDSDQLSSIVNTGFSNASSFNQQSIRNEKAKGNFWTENVIGTAKVLAAAYGAYGLDQVLTAATVASTAAGTAGSAVPVAAPVVGAGEVGGALYTTATPGFIGPSAALVGGADIAAANWAATSYALTNAASSFGMGALKGAGMSVLTDVLSGQDINFRKAGIGALTGGVGASAGSLGSFYAAPYGEFASKAAGAIGGGLAGGITQAGLTGRDIGTGAMYGALAGLTSLKSVGIDSTGGRILADAAIGGARTTLRGGDFLQGAISSGTRSAVSAGVNTASQYGSEIYKSTTSPSYEFGIKTPTSKLDINTDLFAAPVPTSDFTIRPPTDSYTYGELNATQGQDFYTPVYGMGETGNSAIAKNLSNIAKSTVSNALTSSILGTSSQPSRTKTAAVSSTLPQYSGSSDIPKGLDETAGVTATTTEVYPSKYELRKFANPSGNTTLVSFKDNQPQTPIPSGYKQVEVIGAAKGGLIEGQDSTTMVKYSKKPLLAQRKKEIKIAKKGLASR